MRERELYRAIMENNVVLAREIIATRNVNVDHIEREDENDGSPLLVCAINNGRMRIARDLIAAGANVNLGNDGSVRDKFTSMTPLWCAVPFEVRSRADVGSIVQDAEDLDAIDGLVALLLERGANPNQKSCTGATPLEGLLFWYSEGSPEKAKAIFDLFIAAGADEDCLYHEEHKEKFRQLLFPGSRLRK